MKISASSIALLILISPFWRVVVAAMQLFRHVRRLLSLRVSMEITELAAIEAAWFIGFPFATSMGRVIISFGIISFSVFSLLSSSPGSGTIIAVSTLILTLPRAFKNFRLTRRLHCHESLLNSLVDQIVKFNPWKSLGWALSRASERTKNVGRIFETKKRARERIND